MVLYQGKYHSPNHCPLCDSRNVKHSNVDYVEHNLCEVDVVCNDCGAHAFWGYGFYDMDCIKITSPNKKLSEMEKKNK